ncbi:hypothetical protein O9929_24660 [Vibrio lentus]|nr:hypothetical protein [Vibrio lentus]
MSVAAVCRVYHMATRRSFLCCKLDDGTRRDSFVIGFCYLGGRVVLHR